MPDYADIDNVIEYFYPDQDSLAYAVIHVLQAL